MNKITDASPTSQSSDDIDKPLDDEDTKSEKELEFTQSSDEFKVESSEVSFRPSVTRKSRFSCLIRIANKIKSSFSCVKNKPNSNHDFEYTPPPKNKQFAYSPIERGIHKMSTWCYRSKFTMVLLSFTFVYFALITVFAFLLYVASSLYQDKLGRSCISIDYDQTTRFEKFEFVFDLSWTTFSTVGYGVISPDSVSNCWLIRVICAIESFNGILFASCCGAILYSKINRIQYRAPVTFSRSICLQYGKGLIQANVMRNSMVLNRRNEASTFLFPKPTFPFIEFRIVHDGCDEIGSAIVDASVACFVILPSSITGASTHGEYSVPNWRHSSRSSRSEHPVGYKEKFYFPGKIFHKLKIDNEKLPFYDKVWYVRHTLDENSPLLKDEVKQKISRLGTWPLRLNSHQTIKESLIDFQVITVQLQGMSQVTASPVYAEMIYDNKSIYIGWQFTGLLYCVDSKNGEPKLLVDKNLVHDIAPQRGGGHEPISERDDNQRISFFKS